MDDVVFVRCTCPHVLPWQNPVDFGLHQLSCPWADYVRKHPEYRGPRTKEAIPSWLS